MRLNDAWILALAAAASAAVSVEGFQLARSPSARRGFAAAARKTRLVSSSPSFSSLRAAATAVEPVEVAVEIEGQSNGTGVGDAGEHAATATTLTFREVQSLPFRGLRRTCKDLGLSGGGTTAALRSRLMDHFSIVQKTKAVVVEEVTISTAEGAKTLTAAEIEEVCETDGITFCDDSSDIDYKNLLAEIMSKCDVGHWKAATRKLKSLDRKFATPDRPVPREAYLAVLEACASDRLHGARAAEPARKILEDMATRGYELPPSFLVDGVVSNCLGEGPGGTHDGFGGVDAALAMVAAVESGTAEGNNDGVDQRASVLSEETYGRLAHALAKDGAFDEAILVLRSMVAEKNFTPSLAMFADAAMAAAKSTDPADAELALQVLTYVKAAGYELDGIAEVEAGREVLAAGVVAAEKMGNLALGLRLLTAAGKAEGCTPDSGDVLVAASSSAAQRACMLIHKNAAYAACQSNNWKLAVKVLELMVKRGLNPATSVWRNVVSVCCKNKKSRKATAILLDWITLSEEGRAGKPPVSAFNTVINTCEACGEEELTVLVLNTMKKVIDSDGNIITFNIALKRLAKTGNILGCEGILVGMLKEGIEPTVVSYTTTIGSCAKQGFKNPAMAYTWLQRMRVRKVLPNFHTYNTALAACLDGKVESTALASQIASEMIIDGERDSFCGIRGSAKYTSAVPDTYTQVLARELMKQLRENWRSGDIDMAEAKSTLRVPLLGLVDFNKTITSLDNISCELPEDDDEVEEAELIKIEDVDQDFEFDLLAGMHKDEHRTAMV